MKELMEKMMKKASSESNMDDKSKQAKMDVLHELMNMAHSMMADKTKSGMDEHMQKISVMAPDKEHLSEGLDKAQELLGEDGPREHAGPTYSDAMAAKLEAEDTQTDSDDDLEDAQSAAEKEMDKKEGDSKEDAEKEISAESKENEEKRKPKKKRLFDMSGEDEE